MEPVVFDSPLAFRAWLGQHHETASELWVGFYKRHTGKPSLTWPESVDEALSYGWIDAVRKSIDADRYAIRFVPRKQTSIWSAINVKRVEELTKEGRMQPGGLAAFAAHKEAKSRIYAYEQRKSPVLDPADLATFQANPDAWAFFQSQAPWYHRNAIWWVVTAKQTATHQKRLARLIEDSAGGRKLDHLSRWSRA